MIAYRSRDADATRRTLSLKSHRHINSVAMQVRSIGYGVTDVNTNAEANGEIRKLSAVMDRNLLLYLHGALHSAIDAVECDQQGVAPGLHNPAAMLSNRRVDQCVPQGAQAFECSCVVDTDETAVTDHVGVQHSHQLSSSCLRCPI